MDLHIIASAISRNERNKLNENWQRIIAECSRLQRQINILGGDAEVDELLENINVAIENANQTVQSLEQQVQQSIENNDTAIQAAINRLNTELQAALNSLSTAITNARDAITATKTATTNANTATSEARTATTNALNAIAEIRSFINSFDFSGEYNVATTYQKNNIVRFGRSSYVALKENTGITPNDDGVDWRLLAMGGIDGAGTVSTVNGKSPDENGNIQLTKEDLNIELEELDAHINDDSKHFAPGEKKALQGLIWQNRIDILKDGDLMAGYYGKVTGLITSEDLIAKTGLTAGVTKHTGDITWLKFSHNYKTLLVADRTLKHTISWDDIQAQNLVKGKVVEINGQHYLCRLMTGGVSNPTTTLGGEWNSLIVRFTPNDEDSNWNKNGNSPTGSFSWTQEITNAVETRSGRGYTSIYTPWFYKSNIKTDITGWRPVLELL